jgi:hypothetical protein
MTSVLKLKLQGMTAESLIAAGAQRMNQNNAEHFLYAGERRDNYITNWSLQ